LASGSEAKPQAVTTLVREIQRARCMDGPHSNPLASH
jgi:hypothetical protein